MTVADVIARLEEFPGDWVVKCPEANFSGTMPVEAVYKSLFYPDVVEINC